MSLKGVLVDMEWISRFQLEMTVATPSILGPACCAILTVTLRRKAGK